MKEYDRVKLIVEKECHAKHGVHKGMDGWICDPRNIDGTWLVSFDQFGNKPNIATIAVKETDLKIISTSEFDANNNTKIAEYWDKRNKSSDSNK